MAAKLRAQAPAVVALLLAAAGLLVLAATVADARPLKEEPSSSSEGDDVPTVVVESPAGDIQTVVGTAEDDGAGRNKFVMSIDMLGGIKESGPSPGAGH
ncbi:hypothetical protein SETIT_4G206000v2 [Setaria italica]|uniref:Uncharacterized protein n=1 Tax=Setaria italica TaxID=4555 RepID=K3Y0A8_SETIT|nr:uncharacterized protein LOC101774728 [Setaria italica]RCV22255.1 hypothetical protein SETIT_4G206000v2 [Setaria italica]